MIDTDGCFVGHIASQPCGTGSRDCLKVKLREFVGRSYKIQNHQLHSYIATVSLKSREFINQILSCPSSTIAASKYVFETVFKKDGSCQLDGIIWPNAFCKTNAGEEEMNEDGSDPMLNAILMGVSTSSRTEDIKSDFKLSEGASEDLKALVLRHQTKDLRKGFGDCDIPLPNLLLMQKINVHHHNKVNAATVLDSIRGYLSQLSEAEIRGKTCEEILAKLEEDYFISFGVDEKRVWSFSILDEDCELTLDEGLVKMEGLFPESFFATIYHYSLCCTSQDEIILPRKTLFDCFVIPYNDLYLKALNSTVMVQPMKGMEEWTVSKFSNMEMDSQEDEQIPHYRKLSLTECLGLMDPRKIEILQNTSCKFVYTNPSARMMFKKVKVRNELCYSVPGENGVYYEMMHTNVTRFFMKMNGDGLTLAEFCCFYQNCKKDEAERLFTLYKDKLETIEVTNTKYIAKEDNIPSLILCQNGDVLTKKGCKILKFIEFEEDTYEFKFTRLLLFGLVANYEDITADSIDILYNKCSSGESISIVQKNETEFYRRLSII